MKFKEIIIQISHPNTPYMYPDILTSKGRIIQYRDNETGYEDVTPDLTKVKDKKEKK